MYTVYTTALLILLVVLILLKKEERRLKNNITHGLANKFWVLNEKRNFVRFDQRLKISYDFVNNKGSNNYNSETSNISSKGLCLMTYEKFKSEDCLDLEMCVPGFSKPVRLIGQVAWTRDLQKKDEQGRRLFYVGIKFSKINPKYEAMLLTYLNTLKRD